MDKTYGSKILKYLSITGIVLTIALLIVSPFIVTAFFKSNFQILEQSLIIKVCVALVALAVPYILCLFKLKDLCNLIIKDSSFSFKTAKNLKFISYCAFSELFIFIAISLYLKLSTEFFKYVLLTVPFIIVAFVSIVLGLSFLVLSQLFKNATEIKLENDQTI
ncbi:DUF2975 domain-containing protein [Clostridium massiliamazoniense]|uniref:DUF2975 domain-containing protein n=1 Tax=Clostridium massiliamazoniense TaxID=1347366 RepID=UPI0006D7D565|nr:DUF2975 domain-containing protein [Clostridium massiliamazoniense]